MSDALLTEISKKLDTIAGLLKGGAPAAAPKTSAPAAAPKGDANAIAADTTKTAAEKAAAANKAIAERKAVKDAAEKAAAAKGGTKGKKTIDQVRSMIRKVAADVDKQTAKDILKDDGGVDKVLDLKPELYDAVFEACEVVLKGEGKPAATPAEEEDDFA
jgi:hypothetical protein